MAQKIKEIGTDKMVVFSKAVPFHQKDEMLNKLMKANASFEMQATKSIAKFTVTSKIYLAN